jgi:myo-inositol-1(or 4)-monophosphatase
MHPLVNIGIQAARKAGQIMIRSMDQLHSLKIQQKGHNDFVTNIDVACEQVIIDIIRRAYPNHEILGEESGLSEAPYKITNSQVDNVTWIIDPLDGTTNYMHGLPQFCVSIGVSIKNRIEHAVIYDPVHDELFTASHGGGAQLNEKRIRVAPEVDFERALIGTGIPFRRTEELDEFTGRLDTYLKLFKKLAPQVAGIRRGGSAALDLAYVAAGRLDGFFEQQLKIWDIAAGSLLVQEAGGLVTGYDGFDGYLQTCDIVCGQQKTHKMLLEMIQNTYPKAVL